MLLFFVVGMMSQWISFQYRNDTGFGTTCGENSPTGDIVVNSHTIKHTFRDFFFREDRVWGNDEEGYYKGFTYYDFGNYVQLMNCSDSSGIGCKNITSNDTLPCYSKYAINQVKDDGTYCFKYVYPCINGSSDFDGYFFNAKAKKYDTIDDLPDYFYKQMFLTVWDDEADCTKLTKDNIVAGRVYKSWNYNMSGVMMNFGIPDEWVSVLGDYDGRSPECVDELSLQYRCSKSRLFVDTFYKPPGHPGGCGGVPNATYTMEHWLYGDVSCSFEKMKFVCGEVPFVFEETSQPSKSFVLTVFSSFVILCTFLLL